MSSDERATPLERKILASKKAYLRKQESYHFDMTKFRSSLNLPTIKSGHRGCIRCDRDFFSNDLRCERMCVECREKSVNYADDW